MTLPDAKKQKTEKHHQDAKETPKYLMQAAAATKASGTRVAASGASENTEAGAVPSPPPPLSFTALLGMDSLRDQDAYLAKWATESKAYVDKLLLQCLKDHDQKVSFTIPSSLLLLAPLEINSAASGAQLPAFREVMNYDNLLKAFAQSAQYEAAGTI